MGIGLAETRTPLLGFLKIRTRFLISELELPEKPEGGENVFISWEGEREIVLVYCEKTPLFLWFEIFVLWWVRVEWDLDSLVMRVRKSCRVVRKYNCPGFDTWTKPNGSENNWK